MSWRIFEVYYLHHFVQDICNMSSKVPASITTGKMEANREAWKYNGKMT